MGVGRARCVAWSPCGAVLLQAGKEVKEIDKIKPKKPIRIFLNFIRSRIFSEDREVSKLRKYYIRSKVVMKLPDRVKRELEPYSKNLKNFNVLKKHKNIKSDPLTSSDSISLYQYQINHNKEVSNGSTSITRSCFSEAIY